MGILEILHKSRPVAPQTLGPQLAEFVNGYSIEVTPTTLNKIENLQGLFPVGTNVFIAHIAGTHFDAMLTTARRLQKAGYHPVPHVVARSLPSRSELNNRLQQYRDEAGVDQALLLAGSDSASTAAFANSMQLVETELFDAMGFQRLYFAGHPEGNSDIDPDGGTTLLDDAISWKQTFSRRSNAEIALITQFVFDAKTVIQWSERIAVQGINMPIHVGLAGPARIQTLIKYALSCGVGASLRTFQKRAIDFATMMKSYTPDAIATDLACHVAENPETLIKKPHFFPFGGIETCAQWIRNLSK